MSRTKLLSRTLRESVSRFSFIDNFIVIPIPESYINWQCDAKLFNLGFELS